MKRNKKLYYIIVLLFLAMYLMLWLLKTDKPVQVDAKQTDTEQVEEAYKKAGWWKDADGEGDRTEAV